MNKENPTSIERVYSMLEESMVKYKDLINIPAVDNGEDFLNISTSFDDNIVGKYMDDFNDMASEFPEICVRSSVREKLILADIIIKSENPSLRLMVTYGYRSLEVQEKRFNKEKEIASKNPIPGGSSIDEEVHRLIAVPSVAGHPTGGAVDVTIVDINSGIPIDFGTKIYDFKTRDIYTFSPYISESAKNNRMLLRKAMMSQGFAPYDGEWWHFSYGDKEWAFYYKQVSAIYTQKKSSDVFAL